MTSRSKSSPYPPLPFHAIRAISFVSTAIVSGIMLYFCYQLKHDGYKLPWTFLITLLASLLSLIALILTALFHCCSRLSPLFNMCLNIPILCLWTVGLALLTYDMYGTLGHSCNRVNWAIDDGLMICRTYKALYSFGVIGWLAQISLVIVDVRARRIQMTRGVYDKVDESRDVKMNSLSRSQSQNNSFHDVPYGIDYQNQQSLPRHGFVRESDQTNVYRQDLLRQQPQAQETQYYAFNHEYRDRRY